MILYATLTRGPKRSREGQTNSIRLFMRELNRFGITSVLNAGSGLKNYSGDYEVVRELHERGELTVRLGYNLFRQKPKQELADFSNRTRMAALNTLSKPLQERAKVAEVIEQPARRRQQTKRRPRFSDGASR